MSYQLFQNLGKVKKSNNHVIYVSNLYQPDLSKKRRIWHYIKTQLFLIKYGQYIIPHTPFNYVKVNAKLNFPLKLISWQNR